MPSDYLFQDTNIDRVLRQKHRNTCDVLGSPEAYHYCDQVLWPSDSDGNFFQRYDLCVHIGFMFEWSRSRKKLERNVSLI